MRVARHLCLVVLAGVVVAGCQVGEDPADSPGASGATDAEQEAAGAVADWLTAAVDVDGAAYCELLTLDLQEKVTGAQSDQATTLCERAASSALAGNLPLRIAVAAQNATGRTADVALITEVPANASLVEESGDFKIDDVSQPQASGEDPGGRPGRTQEEQDAETAVKDLMKAAIDQDGAAYCGQLTVRYVERFTGARSDQATSTCERLVTAEESPTKLPLDLDIVAKTTREKSAQVRLFPKLPTSMVLRKEDGELKVDSMGAATGTSGSSPKPEPSNDR
jgi:hypothetical protein